jgi:hypothetical protein
MKITNEQLKQIIKEELGAVIHEQEEDFPQSPHFINIILTPEGIRLSIKPDVNEPGKIPGVRIPKSVIDQMHPKMYNYITNMGVHYAEEGADWHKSIKNPQVEANFYTILKRLIGRVSWGGSIGDYSIEDLKRTDKIVFSNYTDRRRKYTDKERAELAQQRKAALDR